MLPVVFVWGSSNFFRRREVCFCGSPTFVLCSLFCFVAVFCWIVVVGWWCSLVMSIYFQMLLERVRYIDAPC